MSKFRYAGIEAYDINNGKGFGVTLFVQGCPHHCHGCHNPQTWDFNGGFSMTADIILKLRELFENENIRRFTISGGEPFANFEVSYAMASLFKEICPNKPLWIYTGFRYEELSNVENADTLLAITDVLVDGKYIEEERDLSLPFRGSRNQRIIDIAATRNAGDIVLYNIE